MKIHSVEEDVYILAIESSCDETAAAVVKNGYKAECVGEIERTKFYEKARNAYLTVCTSERLPYGCIILQKGVM